MHVDKIDKDRRVLEAMGSIYCQGNHSDTQKDEGGMCQECRTTIEQTLSRAASCPYGHEGNCQDCETHCQRGDAQIRIPSQETAHITLHVENALERVDSSP